MNWQPIETAPKDETSVLILTMEYKKRVVTEAYFQKDEDEEYVDDGGYWVPVTLSIHGCGCCRGSYPKPTHWVPLLDLPTT
jgi:hypothetical protein